MPLYEYRCTACNRLTEKRQKFSDPEITDCPLCGGHLERTITAPAIQFKGGGWFADGYGNKKPANSGSAETGTENTGSKPETKSESKSDSPKPSTGDSGTSSTPAPAAASPAPSTPAPAATK